ncbi:MAG: transposase zinc-binding domain-containing protein [Thermodesulfobacteriota bacterium]|nr:transposase zinc-binding domain-containing protein [Thermodesulfobacteriota bacterium]
MSETGCEKSSPVTKPTIEVADILREYGQDYLNNYSASPEQIGVINQIITCRTAAQGGHIEFCDSCGHSSNSYNSCRNRHCPKCQTFLAPRYKKKNIRIIRELIEKTGILHVSPKVLYTF